MVALASKVGGGGREVLEVSRGGHGGFQERSGSPSANNKIFRGSAQRRGHSSVCLGCLYANSRVSMYVLYVHTVLSMGLCSCVT